MAKKAYIGVNNIAKNVKDIYVKTGNELKKVSKGYVGVNGVAEVFWEPTIEIPDDNGFWANYATTSGRIIMYVPFNPNTYDPNAPALPSLGGYPTINKINNGLSFYCVAKDNTGICIISLSTINNGANFTNTGATSISTGYIDVDQYLPRWYYTYTDLRPKSSDIDYTIIPNSCVIENSFFSAMTPVEIITWILNNKIESNCFAENYQEGQTYNLVAANIRKFVRRFVLKYIYHNEQGQFDYEMNNGHYDIPKALIYQNIENIVDFFATQAGNHNIISIGADYSRGDNDVNGLAFYAWYANDPLTNITITTDASDGMSGYGHSSDICSIDKEIVSDTMASVDFTFDGNIIYHSSEANPWNSIISEIGAWFGDYGYMYCTNIGITL